MQICTNVVSNATKMRDIYNHNGCICGTIDCGEYRMNTRVQMLCSCAVSNALHKCGFKCETFIITMVGFVGPWIKSTGCTLHTRVKSYAPIYTNLMLCTNVVSNVSLDN